MFRLSLTTLAITTASAATMKDLFKRRLTTKNVTSSCSFEPQATCGNYEVHNCQDACWDHDPSSCKTDPACKMEGSGLFSMCQRVDDTTSCYSKSDETACKTVAGCRWKIAPCGWRGECSRKSCYSRDMEADCKAIAHCKWDGTFCNSENGMYIDECGQHDDDAVACAADPICEHESTCKALEECDYANKGDCTGTAGCFWVEQNGKMDMNVMGSNQNQDITPECMSCFSAPGENAYLWFKNNEGSGCSVGLRASTILGDVTMSGAVNIITATPAATQCSGGQEFDPFANLDGMGEVDANIDCSYSAAAGDAPMGEIPTGGASTAVASMAVAAAVFGCMAM